MLDFANRTLTIGGYFDRIFYINLKRDIQRNEHILALFKRYGITNFERFEAIEIVHLPHVSQYRNFIKTGQRYIAGQLSCRASHIECIKIAKRRGYKKILMFEDDIEFLEDPNLLLAHNQAILNDWDMLYFGGLVEPFYRNQIVCTHAYAIKETLFDNLIYMADASGMEIDNFYAKILQQMSYNYNASGKYNIRTILPFNKVVQNAGFKSNIHF